MKTNDIIISELTTIDIATLDHVTGGYDVLGIIGKTLEGAWEGAKAGMRFGPYVGGAAALLGAGAEGGGEYLRERDAAAARKADRQKRVAGGAA